MLDAHRARKRSWRLLSVGDYDVDAEAGELLPRSASPVRGPSVSPSPCVASSSRAARLGGGSAGSGPLIVARAAVLRPGQKVGRTEGETKWLAGACQFIIWPGGWVADALWLFLYNLYRIFPIVPGTYSILVRA